MPRQTVPYAPRACVRARERQDTANPASGGIRPHFTKRDRPKGHRVGWRCFLTGMVLAFRCTAGRRWLLSFQQHQSRLGLLADGGLEAK